MCRWRPIRCALAPTAAPPSPRSKSKSKSPRPTRSRPSPEPAKPNARAGSVRLAAREREFRAVVEAADLGRVEPHVVHFDGRHGEVTGLFLDGIFHGLGQGRGAAGRQALA